MCEEEDCQALNEASCCSLNDNKQATPPLLLGKRKATSDLQELNQVLGGGSSMQCPLTLQQACPLATAATAAGNVASDVHLASCEDVAAVVHQHQHAAHH